MTVHHPHPIPMATPGTSASGTIAIPPDGTPAPRQVALTRTSRPRCTYASTLRTLSGYLRGTVWRVYRALGGTRGRLNDYRRALLSEAIVQIEHDLKHHQAKPAQVATLQAIRSRLHDDLGWNENPPAPLSEATHAA